MNPVIDAYAYQGWEDDDIEKIQFQTEDDHNSKCQGQSSDQRTHDPEGLSYRSLLKEDNQKNADKCGDNQNQSLFGDDLEDF